MRSSEKFERMNFSELEQFIKINPHDRYVTNRTAWYVYACRLLNGIGCPKNSSKALDCLEEIAPKHSRAALQAGICYFNGVGTAPDYNVALEYFEHVSNVADATTREGYLWKGKCLLKIKKAQEAVACLKQVPVGVKIPQKIVHTKPAIEKEAKCLLGMCYYHGIGVEENKETAFRYLKEASLGEGASPAAQYYLAKCYQNGIGTAVNPERAEHWRSTCFEQNYKEVVDEMKGLLGITIK